MLYYWDRFTKHFRAFHRQGVLLTFGFFDKVDLCVTHLYEQC